MPIISTLLILLTTKHSNIFMTNYFLKKIANGALILLFIAITFKLAVQHKNPNAISILEKNLDKSIIKQHFEMDSILKTVPDLPKINFNNWQERLKASN